MERKDNPPVEYPAHREAMSRLAGLNDYTWKEPKDLLLAKARVKAADLHPLANDALRAIEAALEAIVQTELTRLQSQQNRALDAWAGYLAGRQTLSDTWRALADIADPNWEESY